MPGSERRGIWTALAWLAAGFAGGALAAFGLVTGARALWGEEEPPAALGAPRLVEETATSGISHVYDGEFQFFVGGGVAVFDCDDDGLPDLYLAGGALPASLYRNGSEVGGALHFSRVADAATDLTGVVGAYPLDVDGDGIVDLAVLRAGENVLLRGRGECRFERASEAWSFDGGTAWTAAFSAAWESDDAFPMLAFGNYLARDEAGEPTFDCDDSVLLRPEGAAYPTATPLAPGYCTLSMLFGDWDHTGRRDLRLANDRHYYRDGEEQLWRVAAGEPPRLYTREEGWKRLVLWGMGIAAQDLTGDGLPEVVITSQGDNKLQSLDPGAAGPAYGDIAIRLGATAHRPFAGGDILPSTAWHPEFQDVNNDGFMDLYISKGNVEAMPDFAAQDPSNLLLGGPGGAFVEGARDAGYLSFGKDRGAALVDCNLDGLPDLVQVVRREDVRVWRNAGSGDAAGTQAMGHWLALQLEQPGANGFGVGAWIEVRSGDRTTLRQLTVGGGHAGGQLGWIHFGLGEARSAEVRVQWPDGEFGPWQKVGADGFVVIVRDGEPRRWSPGDGAPRGER
ncbi:MAG: CRTAC1 family protein [Actinobacteria bacterium]|nr:CRTAC1 family protein [Actinomycetota bacterium]